MPASILVAYATRYGATREVAEAVTAVLHDQSLDVELQPARTVQSLETYGAVVLGAPLYMSRWHADAMRFLSRHRKDLVARRVAIFALGPWHDSEKERQESRAQLDKELLKHRWLAPAAVQVFGGKFDPAKLGFPYTLIGPLKKLPPEDARDWSAIRAWAAGLASSLQPQGG